MVVIAMIGKVVRIVKVIFVTIVITVTLPILKQAVLVVKVKRHRVICQRPHSTSQPVSLLPGLGVQQLIKNGFKQLKFSKFNRK